VRRLLLLGVVVAVLVAGAALVARSSGGVGADRAASATATSGATVPGPVGPSGPPLAAVSPSPSLLPSPSPRPSPSPEAPRLPDALLQAALDHWLVTTGTPGVSVTIRWADGRSWTGVGGLADAAARTAMTPATAFPLASISKTFVAALVLELVQDGRLALDQPVAPILAGLGLDRRVTVRMLLDHTSGLPDIFSAAGIDRALVAAPDRLWTLAQSLAFTRTGRVTPGTRWTYSNTNYLLLGILLERVTREPFAALLRDRILGPLGLASAYVQIAEAAPGPLAAGHVVARAGSSWRASVIHRGPVQPFTSVVSAGGAADDIAAGSADVARWAAMLYGGHVLEPVSLAAMLGDIASVAKLHPRMPYGLGVEGYTLPGWGAAYGHNGHLAGFQDLVRYLPGQDLSIAILSNADAAPVKGLFTTLLSIALPLGAGCDRCR
jgi:D-alanyl-D-alanine carboxypeptidase